jgi:hypothetical protein
LDILGGLDDPIGCPTTDAHDSDVSFEPLAAILADPYAVVNLALVFAEVALSAVVHGPSSIERNPSGCTRHDALVDVVRHSDFDYPASHIGIDSLAEQEGRLTLEATRLEDVD